MKVGWTPGLFGLLDVGLLGFVLLGVVLLGASGVTAEEQVPLAGNRPVVDLDLTQSNPALERSVVLTSADPIVRAAAVVVLEPELRSAPIVEQSAALAPIVPHARERETIVEQLPGDGWKISVKIHPSDLRPKAKLTVIGYTAAGKVVVAPVQWLQPSEQFQNFGQLAEIRCDLPLVSPAFRQVMGLGVESLSQLVAVRMQRKQLLEELVRESLTDKTLDRLNALEAKLGTQGAGVEQLQPMTASVGLEDLVERLLALQAAKDLVAGSAD